MSFTSFLAGRAKTGFNFLNWRELRKFGLRIGGPDGIVF